MTSKPSIIFLNHSSFIFQTGTVKLLVDPWLYGSIFNEGWDLLSEEDHGQVLSDITHIYYSHEHPDHFHVPFLKSIDPARRTEITILFQQTYDQRVKNFCSNLGYKVIEFEDQAEIKISENTEITIGKVPFFDSWINIKYGDMNILNVNDCVLEKPSAVRGIKDALNRNIDILFTQFSYAGYLEKSRQRVIAAEILEKIKMQDDVLSPGIIVPFASFLYFSHEENRFMNENGNTLRHAYEFIKQNCKAQPVVLRPNEYWDLSEKNNEESLAYWDDKFGAIAGLPYHPASEELSAGELQELANDYLRSLRHTNNSFIINALSWIGVLPKINIKLTDLDKFFQFDLIKGLRASEAEFSAHDCIALSSESLACIFKHDYGYDTVLVSARLDCTTAYLGRVTKCLFVGSLNNTGRYLRFSQIPRLVNLDFLVRGLELINLKKRQY